MLQEAIGLSVVLGFLSSEFLGLSAGGLVSPGYLAFFLEQPYRLAATIVLSLLIFLAVRFLQRFVIIYGKRRFMATVLLSLAGAWGFERLFFYANVLSQDMRIVGFIIPGLIANDMLRQGAAKTIAMTLIAAMVIRLAMLVIH